LEARTILADNSILKQLLTPSNIGITLLILGLFILSFIKINKKPKAATVLPGIIAAIGIIGTFLGIFLGLLEFNPKDIEGSVPNLIDGMRTAFFTSLLGLTLSNVLKGWKAHKINKVNQKDTREEDVSLERIAELMNIIKISMVESNEELVKNIKEMNKEQEITRQKTEESMEKMVKALVGDSETSMTTQMKLLRTDLVDSQREAQNLLNEGLNKMGNHLGSLVESNNAISAEIEKGNNELITEFRNFAKDMAENNMKAFIEAIQEAIKDLNNQLQEQFGENFKHLNLAVEKLLEWQEHYKETVEKTNDTQNELYKGMIEAKNLVTEIMKNTKPIIETANRLGDKIITLDTQEEKLYNSIELLNKISQDAKILLPNLDDYISKYHDIAEKTIIDSETHMKSLVDNIKNTLTESNKKVEEQILKNTANLDSYSSKYHDTAEKTITDSETHMKSLVDNIKNTLTESNKKVEEQKILILLSIMILQKKLLQIQENI